MSSNGKTTTCTRQLRIRELAGQPAERAELPCVPGQAFYRSIPVLDLTVPSDDELRAAAAAIEEARRRGRVLVCCALGLSRSAAAVVAWLLTTRRAATFDDATAMVRRARPAIVLRSHHRAALEALA